MRSLIAVATLLLCTVGLAACAQEKVEPEPQGVVASAWRESGTVKDSEYVALGDSYVTAPGVPETDLDNPCVPSTNNYPALVAKALTPDHVVDASCGGARTEDLTTSQGPGRLPQFDALSKATTLVTITIGGNDNNVFASLVTSCVSAAPSDPTGSPCRDLHEANDAQSLLGRADATAADLDQALAQIPKLAPNALVVVVGYPRLFPESGTCPDRFPLAAGDFAYANEINAQFNEALEKSARNQGFEFVDMWKLSKGHDVCSDDPWVNGARNQPGKAAPFHPFAAAQVATAEAIVKVVNQQR